MNYPQIPLEEYCLIIPDHPIPGRPDEDEQGMYRVHPNSIKYSDIDFSVCKKISTMMIPHIERYTPQFGDVLIASIGSNAGKVIYFVKDQEPSYLISNFITLRCTSVLRAKWLYHYLRTEIAHKDMENMYRRGAVMPLLSHRDLRNLMIPAPNDKTMQELVDSLDALLTEQSECIKRVGEIETAYRAKLSEIL